MDRYIDRQTNRDRQMIEHILINGYIGIDIIFL